MIIVIASIKVKENSKNDFLNIFNKNVPKVLQEKGCIEYIPTVDHKTDIPVQVSDALMVTIIEKWESLEHLKAHFIAPHMLQYKKDVANIVDKVSIKVLEPSN
jgi:quinol monooxygenase YgiN